MSDTADNFTCPVCLEIFSKPVIIPSCFHRFCRSCLDAYKDAASPTCPVCRQVFNPKHLQKDSNLEKNLSLKYFDCWACKKKVNGTKMRSHLQKCETVKEDVSRVDVPRSKARDELPPNRATFSCPFCAQPNLDTFALVMHVSTHHQRNNGIAVICPICVAMPWGDPNQKTNDFIGHLNRRHQFEYDTFVDFNADEDAVLAEVLARSVAEK